jgi:hypothetical protein
MKLGVHAISRRIRALEMRSLGISQVECAQRFGVSDRAIRHWEAEIAGRRRVSFGKSAVADAIEIELTNMRSENARAKLLSAYARLAERELKLQFEERRLAALHRVRAEHDAEATISAADPEARPSPNPSRFAKAPADPEVRARAVALLRELTGGPVAGQPSQLGVEDEQRCLGPQDYAANRGNSRDSGEHAS